MTTQSQAKDSVIIKRVDKMTEVVIAFTNDKTIKWTTKVRPDVTAITAFMRGYDGAYLFNFDKSANVEYQHLDNVMRSKFVSDNSGLIVSRSEVVFIKVNALME